CPLVTKVHMEVAKLAREGAECVLVGHRGHPEVEGTLGRYDAEYGGEIYLVENVDDVATLQVRDGSRLGYVTQTTLSMDDTSMIVDALKQRFPAITGPRKDDICYATQNRQDAVRQLALECDLVLVVGSANSSNSNRLRELAARCGAEAYLIDSCEDIRSDWLLDKTCVGITAGASAPELLVQEVRAYLEAAGGRASASGEDIRESVSFSLPMGLR
ncbi:MAG TPA: 4-hydroxy-3-methylbut-2-enyl diphosphate reductase, partial [Porticoccaceae bacterium]|nr:4-hydroxy-3-methylbut-2-enyl diphosphate reductase [Porticoccaceae bacterium]